MNVKRILTALIGFPIVVCVFVFGNKYILDVILAAIAIVSMYEYIKCASEKANVISWISYLCVASIAFIHTVPVSVINFIATLGVPILLLILFLHVIITNMRITFKDISYTLIGILYILCFIMFVSLTYGIEGHISGKVLVWYIMLSAWGTDVCAYLFGKSLGLGKTKFSKVSPNKSIEGCIYGAIGAVIICLIYTVGINIFLGLEISYLSIAIISLILSIIGQIGDFAASVIKRYFEVKDFSNLFPGHGGMLDRIDSVMFIAPFAYLLLTMFL